MDLPVQRFDADPKVFTIPYLMPRGPRPAFGLCDPFGVDYVFCALAPGALRDPGLMALIPSG